VHNKERQVLTGNRFFKKHHINTWFCNYSRNTTRKWITICHCWMPICTVL